jgi:NifU-like protein involved in Fe-S cluster formation
MEDAVMRVYNQELVALSAQAEQPRHLSKPDISAKAVSPICGSEVNVEFTLQGGKVSDFGYEVEACALTRSVIAVMKTAVLGKSRQEIFRAGEELRGMLQGGAAPGGDWAGLKILAPVRDYKARHDSILLPFEAAEKAFRAGNL